MAVLGLQPERRDRSAVLHINEITQYKAGRYISSNEAVWPILSFPIHERNPIVVHLGGHLENGQRVYFTSANVQQIALNSLLQHAPGGIGKTLLIRLILAAIRPQNDIASALASSGIAVTLLPSGRTAHSALKLQTLPTIPRSIPADEINAYLKYSTLWRHLKTLKQATNMCVQLENDRSTETFLYQLLEIANRKVPVGPLKSEDVLVLPIAMIPTDTPFSLRDYSSQFDWRLQSPSAKLSTNLWNCVFRSRDRLFLT
ncbi:unnamed protein product [Onchocerca ochengi]|uniref:ATP-dependent DNA helicase n=1 Tax=Onchocerca ochengi TaxID=42157 RepID=A0A182E4M0_ONCOC|nr:unnamed protein product [Onchocerca ochengi]